MKLLSKSLALLLILAAASATNIIGVSTNPAPPSSQVWSRTSGDTGNEWAFSVTETTDGGYAMAGYTTSSGVGNTDFWLVKTDSSGNQLWNKTFGGLGYDWASSVIQTSDGGYGGYALAGSTYSSDERGYDFWLVKTDSWGNRQWNRTYGGAYNDYAASVVQTIDGGYALSGSARDDGYALGGITNSSGAGYEDVWLIKTDSLGNKLWDKTYGGALNDEAYFVMQTQDDGYALAGATYAFGTGLWDAWLIKTDSSGNTLWSQTYGGTGDDQALSLILDSDGGFVLAGSTNTYGAGAWDAWLFKVSTLNVLSGAQSPTPASFSSNPSPLV
jgi:hypothetical protein